MPSSRRALDCGEIGRYAGNAQQAGPVVQGRVQIVGSQAVAALDMGEDAGIEGAGPRGHHQAVQGRETHGRGDREIAADCRRRATAAQVTIDDPQPGRIAAEDLGRPAGAVAVADSVETEAAHAPIGIPCVGQGINVCPGRKLREEGRIEDRHLPRLRQGGLRRGDGRQSRRIVQRGQSGPVGDALLHRAVDQHALGKLGPAVNHAMSYDLDLRQRLPAVGMCFRQALESRSAPPPDLRARRPCGFAPFPRRCAM